MNNELNQYGQDMNTNMNQGNVQPNNIFGTQFDQSQMQSVQPQVQPVQPQVQPVQPQVQPVQPQPDVDSNINVNQNVQSEIINPSVNPNNIEQEQPKYGFESNEEKANLNDDNKSNIRFIIILAILMLAFIILLPYLSNLL